MKSRLCLLVIAVFCCGLLFVSCAEDDMGIGGTTGGPPRIEMHTQNAYPAEEVGD